MRDVKVVDSDFLETLKICYLYADLGMTYQAISGYLGISTATVGRKIKAAREEELLEDKVTFRLPEEFLDIRNYIISNPKLEQEIIKRFGEHLDEIIVVPSGSDIEAARDYAAAAVARLLEERLTGSNVLGVNWGHTILKVAKALNPPKPNPRLTCVPIFGNLGLLQSSLDYKRSSPYESTRIAYLMAHEFGALDPIGLSFQAFIPQEFADSGDVRSYIENDISYQEVFGKKSERLFSIKVATQEIMNDLDNKTISHKLQHEFAEHQISLSQKANAFIKHEGDEWRIADNQQMYIIKNEDILNVYKARFIKEVDTIVSSIGALDKQSAWFRFTTYLGHGDPKHEFEELQSRGVVGDIGQHFVKIQGLVSESDPLIAGINKRVFGLNPNEHFVDLVKSYREQNKSIRGAGLVIVTVGTYKARATIAAIRSGVNNLVVDENLAQEIIRIFDEQIDVSGNSS